MEFLIRNAEEKDWAAVTALMSRVQEMHVAWRPDIYKPNPEMIPQAVFAKILESGTCYVAQAGEQVAGVMLVAFCHSGNASHVERDVLYIDSMAVEEGYRGLGIGHAFFETARQLCREKGMQSIELQVLAENQAACAMYRSCGFTDKAIKMELPVSV